MKQPSSSSRSPDRTRFVVVVIALVLVLVLVARVAWFVWSPRSVSAPAAAASPAAPPPAAAMSANQAAPAIATPTGFVARPANSSPRATSSDNASNVTTSGTAMAAMAPPPPTSTDSGVAIRDGKTIDFSSGKPVLKDSPEEKARMAEAVKDMEAATKEISFGPTPKQTAPTKQPAGAN